MINGVIGNWEGLVMGIFYEFIGLNNSDNVIFEVCVFIGGVQLDCEVVVGEMVCFIVFCIFIGIVDVLIDFICFGVVDGSVIIIMQGGIVLFMFSFDGGMLQFDFIFIGLSVGNYQVIFNDVNGCVDIL